MKGIYTFPEKRASTMGTPTTVGIDDDFTTCDTSVTLRSTNDESTGRLNVINGTFVKEILWNDFTDNFLHYFLSESLCGDIFGMLSRDYNRVNSKRNKMSRRILTIFNGDLGF